jgi:exopolysaccharide biosynthesis polyprenyl glycosylphosphotransferase
MNRKLASLLAGLLGNGILVPLSYWTACLIRFGTPLEFSAKFPPVFLGLLTLVYLTVFYFFNLYSPPKRSGWYRIFLQITIAVITAAILMSLLKYVLYLIPIGRGVFVIANGLIIIAVFFWKIVSTLSLNYFRGPQGVLVIGSGKDADDIGLAVLSNPHELRFVGHWIIRGVDADFCSADRSEPPTKVSIDDLPAFLKRHSIDIVILALSSPIDHGLISQLFRVQLEAVEVVDVFEMTQRLRKRIPISRIPDKDWFLRTKGFAAVNSGLYIKIKRILDFSISTVALVLSFPLWPLIALLIKLDSKGPVFYSQNRLGRQESVFLLHKFRSMIEGAEINDPLWAKKDDPRITRVGKVLRKFHLDELPQLWNVMRGEMSLVGPRPERPEFVGALKSQIPYYSLRHVVKPGLTGWAQINLPYASSMEDAWDKLEHDLYYISHLNFLFDLKILVDTLLPLHLSTPRTE